MPLLSTYGEIEMNEEPGIFKQIPPCDCKHEADITTLKSSRDDMKRTLDGVSTKLDLILAQITKVAVLEEKHSNATSDINRAHLYINNIEKDVESLSKEVREFMNYSRGAAKTAQALWAILSGGVGAMLIKVLFFMGSH